MLMCISNGYLKFQEMSKPLLTTHIYFYYFSHIISGVEMSSVKRVSKYLDRFTQSSFEISKLVTGCSHERLMNK